jgi:hypothetical protein
LLHLSNHSVSFSESLPIPANSYPAHFLAVHLSIFLLEPETDKHSVKAGIRSLHSNHLLDKTSKSLCKDGLIIVQSLNKLSKSSYDFAQIS